MCVKQLYRSTNHPYSQSPQCNWLVAYCRPNTLTSRCPTLHSLGRLYIYIIYIYNIYIIYVQRELVNYWSFAPWQHPRSYQNGYQLVTGCPHGDFIVLPLWKIRPPAPLPDIPLSHIILTLSQPSPCHILIRPSTWLGSKEYQF